MFGNHIQPGHKNFNYDIEVTPITLHNIICSLCNEITYHYNKFPIRKKFQCFPCISCNQTFWTSALFGEHVEAKHITLYPALFTAKVSIRRHSGVTEIKHA